MRRTLLATIPLSFLAAPHAAVAGGGCHTGAPAQEVRTATVTIDHACFVPFVPSVAPGTEVTWTNTSGIEHNITGPAIVFTELPNGATHKVRFDAPGIYVYACTLHPGMSGAVVVRPAAAGNAADNAAAATTGEGTGGGNAATAGWAVAGVAVAGAAAFALTRRPARVPA